MLTNPSAPWTTADRFSSFIKELLRSLGVHGHRRCVHGPLLIVIWSRIQRLARRFASIEARLRAGTLVARPSRARAPKPRIFGPFPHRPVNGLPPDMPAPPMPRGFGWLQMVVPELHMSAGQLCALLQTPDMRALFADAPQLGKVLRPLAHMLGLRITTPGNEDLVPGLELPRRPRIRKPNATRKPRPARPRPKPPAEQNPWAQQRFHGPPWRTQADAMGIPRKIRD